MCSPKDRVFSSKPYRCCLCHSGYSQIAAQEPVRKLTTVVCLVVRRRNWTTLPLSLAALQPLALSRLRQFWPLSGSLSSAPSLFSLSLSLIAPLAPLSYFSPSLSHPLCFAMCPNRNMVSNSFWNFLCLFVICINVSRVVIVS